MQYAPDSLHCITWNQVTFFFQVNWFSYNHLRQGSVALDWRGFSVTASRWQIALCERNGNLKKVMTLKPRLLNLLVEIMDPSIQMSTVHNKHIVELHIRQQWGRGQGRKKYKWQREWGRTAEWDIQETQWHGRGWCHSSAKVAFISQGDKLVFIRSLEVRDLWVRCEERGTTEGGKYMICQQTAGTNNLLVL